MGTLYLSTPTTKNVKVSPIPNVSARDGTDSSLLPAELVINLAAITFRQARSYFPSTEHHYRLAGSKLYCLVTAASVHNLLGVSA